jgi:hypothetical protein
MTVTEIVDELRLTRPRAAEALRLHVVTVASSPQVAQPSLLTRLRSRRVFVLVPAAAGIAVAGALAIGVTRPTPTVSEATAPVERVDAARDAATLPGSLAGPTEASTALAQKAPPGTVSGRAQRYVASLTLAVEDTDALSEATQRALSIARDLGGFVVAVRYATGDEGASSVTLRVPSGRAGDAVTRLSALGTIVAQNVQIDDLQESLDGLDKALQQLHAQLAALNAQLAGTLTAAERARLRERRAQVQAQLRELRASRTATATEARLATFQVELRTEQDEGVAAPGSRLDRALDRALEVLAWEAVVALAIAVAVAPLAFLAIAVWAARRVRRRREDDRLLATS